MSLNKFTNTETGFQLDLDIGCDTLKANNITTDNIDANTINGGPIGGGVTNPLTSDLKLGGFAIIEPLTAVSPALNIDQLDPAKKIDLKVGGVAKVVVKNGEVELKENLNMNQNQIDNCLVVNNQGGQPLNLIGGSNVSAVILDATPTQGVIIGSDVGKSTEITGDTSLDLRCNAGNIDLFPSSQMNVVVGGLPRLSVDATEVNVGNDLNMNQNLIQNCSGVINATNPTGISGTSSSIGESTTNMSQTFTSNQTSIQQLGNQIIRFTPTLTVSSKDIDMTSNSIIGVPEIVGDGGNMTIRNGAGESIVLNSGGNTIDILNNDLNMNSNNIQNANIISSSGNLSLNAGGTGQSILMDGSFITFFQNIPTFVPSFTPDALDMSDGNIKNVSSINGFSPVGGVFSGTSDSLTLSASTAEQTILPLTFVGTLSVPPNGFKVGDSFHCVLAGDFGSNNGDTLTIRLKAGPASTTVLASLVVPLNNSTASSFEAEIDFQLRNVGGAGVADICSNFDFTYNQSGGGGAFVGERGVFQNNTTFDTTVLNALEITAQFSSTNASNTIKTSVSKLSKDY